MTGYRGTVLLGNGVMAYTAKHEKKRDAINEARRIGNESERAFSIGVTIEPMTQLRMRYVDGKKITEEGAFYFRPLQGFNRNLEMV